MSFSLSIPWTLIQGSSIWEGHLVWESLRYFSIWEHVYPFLTSSWELLCLHSEHVRLYICKKKRKKKTHVCSIFYHWVCILMFKGHFIKYVCWWEFVCELSETLHSLYLFCHIFWEWDEWPSLRSSGSLSLPSLRSLLMWLHSMFDLSWSLLLFVLSISPSFSFLLFIHPFHFISHSFLTMTHFWVWYSLCIIVTHLVISSVFFIASLLLPCSR